MHKLSKRIDQNTLNDFSNRSQMNRCLLEGHPSFRILIAIHKWYYLFCYDRNSNTLCMYNVSAGLPLISIVLRTKIQNHNSWISHFVLQGKKCANPFVSKRDDCTFKIEISEILTVYNIKNKKQFLMFDRVQSVLVFKWSNCISDWQSENNKALCFWSARRKQVK